MYDVQPLAAPRTRPLSSAKLPRKFGWALLALIAGLNLSYYLRDQVEAASLWVAGIAAVALACSTTAYRRPGTLFARGWRLATGAVVGLVGLVLSIFGSGT